MRNCWCGCATTLPFNNEYVICQGCETLISQEGFSDEQLKVKNDETDFYGKQYWLNHQNQDLGFPDIYSRARNDLTERNLHWLKTLLKYQLPPAKLMEIGCSHGSFVALAKLAGYQSNGMEMSPWVVDFGQNCFDIKVELGPIENTDLPSESFDVIALMDVLEHLPDPVSTMQHCLALLKPDGFLLIQTPQFKAEMNFDTLLDSKSRFLEQLKYDEHLYLFTKTSVAELFKRLGADYINFEPAIFDVYDMFFTVSKKPLTPLSKEQCDAALMSNANGRMALALMDICERELSLLREIEIINADRAARLEQIITLTEIINNHNKV